MPLSDVRAMVAAAQVGGYAVGYFEAWNLESLQGVVDAAEQTRSPVIIGFNGDFLSRPDRLTAERLSIHAAMGRAVAEEADVPVPFSPVLENAYRPDPTRIFEAVRRMMSY